MCEQPCGPAGQNHLWASLLSPRRKQARHPQTSLFLFCGTQPLPMWKKSTCIKGSCYTAALVEVNFINAFHAYLLRGILIAHHDTRRTVNHSFAKRGSGVTDHFGWLSLFLYTNVPRVFWFDDLMLEAAPGFHSRLFKFVVAYVTILCEPNRSCLEGGISVIL